MWPVRLLIIFSRSAMLFNKKIDTFAVGENYIAYILLLRRLVAGEKVLLVDDDRINLGEVYLDWISSLEQNLLHLYGEVYDIGPLKDIDKFTTNRPATIVAGNRRLLLGTRPVSNLREIVRKFPHWLISPKTADLYASIMGQHDDANHWFNQLCNSYGLQVAKLLFDGADTGTVGFKQLYSICPSQIRPFFDEFKRVVSSELAQEKTEISSILSMLGAIFHNRISLAMGDYQLFHIFLSLLLPHYQVDDKKLTDRLQKLFLARGGLFKKTRVKEWIFHKKGPWAVELESYEGIVRPKDILIVGGAPGDSLFDVNIKSEVYRCFELNIKLKSSDAFTDLVGERFIFSGPQMIGATIPYWDIKFEYGRIEGKVFFKGRDCLKEAFIKNFILKQIYRDLANLIAFSEQDVEELDYSFGPEVILNAIYEDRSLDDGQRSEVSVLDIGNNALAGPLVNIKYVGPYNNRAVGLLSELMAIKHL